MTKSAIADFALEENIENEYHLGIFAGNLEHQGLTYLVISERIGGAFDCAASLFGIFEDGEAALKALNSNGLKLFVC